MVMLLHTDSLHVELLAPERLRHSSPVSPNTDPLHIELLASETVKPSFPPPNPKIESLHVELLASEMIKPSSPPPYPIPLLRSCKLDHVIANIYVKTVHFFSQLHGDFCDNSILKRSLAATLSIFYPFAGTITPAYDIVCNGNGSLFVDAKSNVYLSDLHDLIPHPRLLPLVPALDLSLDVTLRPLFMVQVTRFKCGGVALGLAVEHHVADGVSALMFLKTWSKIARGERISVAPSFDKAWLHSPSSPPTKPRFQHDEYLLLPEPPSKQEQLKHCADFHVPEEEQTVTGRFELPWDLLHKLRLEAGADLTVYEMLAAHVWKCCCEARCLTDAEQSMLIMVVDGRARLGGDHHNFIGNAIFNCCPRLRVADIRRMSLAELGRFIAAALRSVNDELCRSAIDFLEDCSEDQLRRFVKGKHTFRSPNIGFISWAGLPFFEVDLGCSGACSVIPVDMPWEGHAYLIPSQKTYYPPSPVITNDKKRGLCLCIALQRRHISSFARLVTRETELQAV
ncbi:hypothetical protein KP509_05G055700 [Ceratopteris richardii]|uniref:Uncharacterized protein n=1 Tax=Ceratopteris richardii TaxID=49495 RepID=A0A8T2UUK4_CERRI|nr:hypothetical protein KP509_05G055700 [Ceratopteris richardii]